jgi:hypothetical protein
MDKSIQSENPEPEVESGNEIMTSIADPAATKVVSAIEQETPPAPEVVEETKPPISSAQPAAFSSPAAPQTGNRTPIVAIIAVTVVALFCICACTAVLITTLLMIPNF